MTRALNDRCAYLTRQLPDGRCMDVVPLLFGRARLLLSEDIAAFTTLDAW